MKPLEFRTSALYLALICSLLALFRPAAAAAASADGAELEAYLSDRYFEVEFFVFERPDVLDFATEEILTLNRPRALPKALRTQRLNPEALWTTPLDPLTRACLTFPTLSYELLPSLALDADEQPEAPAASTGLDQATAELTPLPLPAIEPVLEADPQLDFLAHMAEFERSLEDGSQRWQPAENFRLQSAASRIERRGLGRILFHGRWLQAVPPREAPDPILVIGGERLDPPLPGHELIGSVGVTLGRYLHFKADLFFHGPGLGLEPAGAVMNAAGESLLLQPQRSAVPSGYMQLTESRRMRSEELHYLDHPKLGLVVRIDPISFPESLLTELEALKALEESAD